MRLRGAPDAFTVRPERIALLPSSADASTPNGERRATGTVREALYLGERTRFVVDLDGGGQLTVVEQNAAASAASSWALPGTPAQLCWERDADQLLPSLTIRTIDKGEHMRRGKLADRGTGSRCRARWLPHVARRQRRRQLGQAARQRSATGEGELNIIAWAGYAEDGSTDPSVDWVHPFERADRLQGQREDRQHQRRDGAADEHR